MLVPRNLKQEVVVPVDRIPLTHTPQASYSLFFSRMAIEIQPAKESGSAKTDASALSSQDPSCWGTAREGSVSRAVEAFFVSGCVPVHGANRSLMDLQHTHTHKRTFSAMFSRLPSAECLLARMARFVPPKARFHPGLMRVHVFSHHHHAGETYTPTLACQGWWWAN